MPVTWSRFTSVLAVLTVIGVVLSAGVLTAAHATATLSRLLVTVTNDGTAPFDAAAGAGADTSALNGVVRSGDYVFFRLDYLVRSPGDLTFTHTLSENAVWDSASTANCLEGAAAISASGTALSCTIAGASAGAGSTTVKARVASAVNGAQLTSSVSASGLTSSSEPVTISSRTDPTIHLRMYQAIDPGFGPGPGTLSTQTGYRLRNALDLWMPVSATQSAHRNQAISSPITFRVSAPSEYPNSSLFGCGALPVVDTQPFASGNPTNSVRNGGTIACSQSAPGEPVTVTISDTDTSLLTWPTRDRGGRLLDATRAYVFVGSIEWWVPVTSWPSGIVTTLTQQVSEFDPLGESGNSNFGTSFQTGFEPGASCSVALGNCTIRSIDSTTPVLKPLNLQSQFRNPGTFNPMPGGTDRSSGDGPFFRGQTGEWVFSAIQQTNTVAQTAVTQCAKWDPTLHQISRPAAESATHAGMPVLIEYGALSYASDAERKSAPCGVAGDGATGWFSSIEAAGGPAAVTAVRMTQTSPMLAGQGMSLILQTKRTAADLVVGAPVPMFMTVFSDQFGHTASSYNPINHTSLGTGHRGLAADVRTSLQTAWTPSSAAAPGQSRTLTVTPMLTAPFETTPRVAENVRVTLQLPTACMSYRPGSASVAPAAITPADWGADGIPCSGDDGVGQQIIWDLGDIAITTPSGDGLTAQLSAITLNIDFDYGIPSPATYTTTATVLADNVIGIASTRQATASLSVVSLTGFSVLKRADRSTLYPGAPTTYTVEWINPTASGLGRATVIDLLPYNGDARTSAFSGSLSLGAVSVASQGSYSSDVVVEYTTDTSENVASALAANPNGDTGITWATIKPSSGVTAVRFVIADLAENERGSATLSVSVDTVTSDTVLGNSVWGWAEQASVGLASQGLTVLGSALTSVSGTVYVDQDFSGTFNVGDSGMNARPVTVSGYTFGPNGLNENGGGDDVTLSAPLSTTTTAQGTYQFVDLLPGAYSVDSPVPSGHVRSESPAVPLVLEQSAVLEDVNVGFQAALAPPVAVNDTITIPMNTAISIPVLNNDTIAGGGATITAVSVPTSGSASRSNQQVVFNPLLNMTGTVTFTYTVTNLQQQSATATVTVHVLAVPEARRDAGITRPATPIVVDALANDFGSQLTITTLGSVSSGTAAIVNGKVQFTPNPGTLGVVSIPYSIRDGAGQTAASTVDITVAEAPLATDDAVSTPRGQPVDISVLANDSGLSLAIDSVTPPNNGTVTANPDGTLTFTPDPSFVGVVTFQYVVSDALEETASASVTVTVLDGPAAVDDTVWIAIGGSIIIPVLDNDAGDGLSVTATTAPQHGAVVRNASGTLTYTSTAATPLTDTLTYTVTDSMNRTSTATVTVHILEPPTAVDDVFEANPDRTYLVLANDIGTNLRVVSIGLSASGSVSIGNSGRVVFTPQSGFTGDASFTYTIEDAAGQRATATVTVRVAAPVNPSNATALARTGNASVASKWLGLVLIPLGSLVLGMALRSRRTAL